MSPCFAGWARQISIELNDWTGRFGRNKKEKMMRKLVVFSQGEFSVTGTSTMALLLVNVLSALYALHIFVQFSPFQVLTVFLAFLAILLGLCSLFLKGTRFLPTEINLRNTLAATLVTFFLVMIYSSQGETPMGTYVRTFPLLEAQLGLGWHQDTVFHVSLIQSILNFGYPSIAQHGHPLTAYHVLSHYVDAFILLVTGVDPFESYGLLAHFKVVLFLSAALLTLAHLCRRHGLMIYLLSIILFLPVLIGTWHIVLSHGLWVPSLLLLASTPFVVSTLYRLEKPNRGELVALFALIVLLSLGKISTGFMFACFVGLWVFIKNPFSLGTMVLGACVLGFFYTYGALFIAAVNNIPVQMDFSSLGLSDFYAYMTAADIVKGGRQTPSQAGQLLLLITLLVALLVMRFDRRIWQILLASVLSLPVLWLITETNPTFSISDVWYFQYGLSSTLVLVGFAVVLENKAALADTLAMHSDPVLKRVVYVLGLAVIVLFSSNFKMTSYNLFSSGLSSTSSGFSYIETNAFSQINTKTPPANHNKLFGPYAEKTQSIRALYQNKSLPDFKSYLNELLAKKDLARSQVALFIPDAIYSTDIARFSGAPWGNGMLMYAVLGVPLVNGVVNISSGYGFSNYSQAALRKEIEGFSLEEGCVQAGAKEILMVSSFSPPAIESRPCPMISTFKGIASNAN